jgi:hypothetical protein
VKPLAEPLEDTDVVGSIKDVRAAPLLELNHHV